MFHERVPLLLGHCRHGVPAVQLYPLAATLSEPEQSQIRDLLATLRHFRVARRWIVYVNH